MFHALARSILKGSNNAARFTQTRDYHRDCVCWCTQYHGYLTQCQSSKIPEFRQRDCGRGAEFHELPYKATCRSALWPCTLRERSTCQPGCSESGCVSLSSTTLTTFPIIWYPVVAEAELGPGILFYGAKGITCGLFASHDIDRESFLPGREAAKRKTLERLPLTAPTLTYWGIMSDVRHSFGYAEGPSLLPWKAKALNRKARRIGSRW